MGRQGRKGAEKKGGRGVAKKGGKKEKRTRENRSVLLPAFTSQVQCCLHSKWVAVEDATRIRCASCRSGRGRMYHPAPTQLDAIAPKRPPEYDFAKVPHHGRGLQTIRFNLGPSPDLLGFDIFLSILLGDTENMPRVGIALAIYRSQKAFPWKTPKKVWKGVPGASRPRGQKRLEQESKMTIFQVFFRAFGSFSTRFWLFFGGMLTLGPRDPGNPFSDFFRSFPGRRLLTPLKKGQRYPKPRDK